MPSTVYPTTEINENGAEELLAQSAEPGSQWLIRDRREDGLNIYYQLCLIPPQGRGYQVNLPWQAEETCPECQGHGRIHAWKEDNSAYQEAPCPECQGQGALNHDHEIILTVDGGLGGKQSIRKRRAGRLNARQDLRGDLIINLTWVETLPAEAAEDAAARPSSH